MAAKPIVAGTDGSEASLRAVDWAAREAALRGSPLRIVAAAALLPRLLDEWRAKYPDVPVSQEVVHGHPGRALVGLSARGDLVVVGRHAKHPGLPGAGSVRHAVLNHAHGPIAVVPSGR